MSSFAKLIEGIHKRHPERGFFLHWPHYDPKFAHSDWLYTVQFECSEA